MSTGMKMVQRLQMKIVDKFDPDYFEVEDESHRHSLGNETHFRLLLVSDQFVGMTQLQRHRLVYETVGEEMTQLHALAVHAYTPEEWKTQSWQTASPKCAGSTKESKH